MSMLDLLLKDFYQEHSLSDVQLESIKKASANKSQSHDTIYRIELTHNSEVNPKVKQQHSYLQNICKGFIAFSFILAVLSPLVLVINSDSQKHQLVNEITLNHQKPFKADVVESDFMNINDGLYAANFDIKVPVNVRKQYHLLGARYCSLADQLAVQLQLLDKKTQQKSSLFITPISESIRPFFSDEMNSPEYKSHYWSNQSLFYALLSENTL